MRCEEEDLAGGQVAGEALAGVALAGDQVGEEVTLTPSVATFPGCPDGGGQCLTLLSMAHLSPIGDMGTHIMGICHPMDIPNMEQDIQAQRFRPLGSRQGS